MFYITLDVKM